MELSAGFAMWLAFRAALSVLTVVAFAGGIAVPAEGEAIRRWGSGSRRHRAVNGLLYGLCGLTVAAVLYAAHQPPRTGAKRTSLRQTSQIMSEVGV